MSHSCNIFLFACVLVYGELQTNRKRGSFHDRSSFAVAAEKYVQTIAANITIPPLQPEDVEEVASDVFLALWNNADAVEEGKLKAWLAAVTRNTAKNKLRSNHLAMPLEDDYFILNVPDVEDELLEQELQTLTREAVASLPEPEHSIFVRHYFLCGVGLERLHCALQAPARQGKAEGISDRKGVRL